MRMLENAKRDEAILREHVRKLEAAVSVQPLAQAQPQTQKLLSKADAA
jgi:hypothetical protein